MNRRLPIRKCSFFSPFIWNRTPELKVRGKYEQDAGSAIALAWAQISKALWPWVDQDAANPVSLHRAGSQGWGSTSLLWIHTFFIFFPHLQQLPADKPVNACLCLENHQSEEQNISTLVGNDVLSLENRKSSNSIRIWP